MMKEKKLSALHFDHPDITDFYDDSTEDHQIERLKAKNQDNNFETLIVKSCTSDLYTSTK